MKSFSKQMDIIFKARKVVESCRMRKHVLVAGSYLNLCWNSVDDDDLKSEISKLRSDLMYIANKPRMSLRDGAWVEVYGISRPIGESVSKRLTLERFKQIALESVAVAK